MFAFRFVDSNMWSIVNSLVIKVLHSPTDALIY